MAGPHGLVKPGGLLLVASTYCWSERTAASQLWLGGTTDSAGNPIRCVGCAVALAREGGALGRRACQSPPRSCAGPAAASPLHRRAPPPTGRTTGWPLRWALRSSW